MVKSKTIENKVRRIEDSLDRLEMGKYSDLPISKISDTICWLWKYRYISKEDMERLCQKAIDVMQVQRFI